MGYEFQVLPANINEKAIRFEDPKELTLAIARAKANVLLSQIPEDAILITADGVVICNGQVLEKPENEEQAREFLRGYAIYPAEVVTSIVVVNTKTGKQAEGTDSAKVYFTQFSEEEIDELIKKGDVFRLSGAFDVEGPIWENHLKKIEGARDSVIGLPKELTKRLIHQVQ